MNRILIAEDDAALASGLCRALTTENTYAESAGNIKTARQKLMSEKYSLIILDVNLPDGSGFDFLTEIRSFTDTPVIMLTANDLESDIVAALEAGADDYITKPFSLAVLRARVNARLRKETPRNPTVFVYDNYIFDFDRMEFTADGTSVGLSKTEQKLLRILTDNIGLTVSREKLVDRIWTDGAEYVDENALSVTVKRLRDKLGAKDYIKTVYGLGYSWVKKDE